MNSEYPEESKLQYKAFSSNVHKEDDYTRWSLLSQAESLKTKSNLTKSVVKVDLINDLSKFNPAPKKVDGTFIAPKDPRRQEASSLFKPGSHSLSDMLKSSGSTPQKSGGITFSATVTAGRNSEPKEKITPADLLRQAQANRAKSARLAPDEPQDKDADKKDAASEESSTSEQVSFFARVNSAHSPQEEPEGTTEPASKTEGKTLSASADWQDKFTPKAKITPADLLRQARANRAKSADKDPDEPQDKSETSRAPGSERSPDRRPSRRMPELPESLREAQRAHPNIDPRPTIAELIEQRSQQNRSRALEQQSAYAARNNESLLNVIHQGTLKPSVDVRKQHNLASTEGVVFREFASGPVLHELKDLQDLKQTKPRQGNFELNAPKVRRVSAAESAQEQRALEVKKQIKSRGILNTLKQKVAHKQVELPTPTVPPLPSVLGAQLPEVEPDALQATLPPQPQPQPQSTALGGSNVKYASLFNRSRYSSRRELREAQRLSDIFKRIESCQ